MSPTLKTLVIRPVDIGLAPLGATSGVADVEVSVSVDRDVALADGTFIPADVPLIAVTSMPAAGLRGPVLANDDPAIVQGSGFRLFVTSRYAPRQGEHALPRLIMRDLTISGGDPDAVPLASKGPAQPLPAYGEHSAPSGVALWTDPDTGERIPYLTAPTSGTLTTIGAPL